MSAGMINDCPKTFTVESVTNPILIPIGTCCVYNAKLLELSIPDHKGKEVVLSLCSQSPLFDREVVLPYKSTIGKCLGYRRWTENELPIWIFAYDKGEYAKKLVYDKATITVKLLLCNKF